MASTVGEGRLGYAGFDARIHNEKSGQNARTEGGHAMMRRMAILMLLCGLFAAVAPAVDAQLANGFRHPPDSAQPSVY